MEKHCGYTHIEMFGYFLEGITGSFILFGILNTTTLHMELLRGLGVGRDRPGHAGAGPAPPDNMEPIQIEGPFASFTVPRPTAAADLSPAALLHWIARPHARQRPPPRPPPRAPRTLRRSAWFS